MKLAILFWFYKEVDVCENRLQLLKKHNPDLKIFGLYGGSKKSAPLFKKRLSKYLDDFYIAPSAPSYWKWIHGDLLILEWYRTRGKKLENWDSVAVIQWDMLVFESLKKTFKGIRKGQIFLSGLRRINNKIENSWDWTKPGTKERKNFLSFLEYVKKHYGYKLRPLICLFILQVFPREFFDRYLRVKNKEIGMLEYKVPVYTEIFKQPLFKKDLGVRWDEKEKEKALNAIPKEIPRDFIRKQLSSKNGRRLFHPYYKKWE